MTEQDDEELIEKNCECKECGCETNCECCDECGENCECDDVIKCNDHCGENLDDTKACECNEECSCGDNCECNPGNKCSENCHCGEEHECCCNQECSCGDECDDENKCSENCTCNQEEYFDPDGLEIDNLYDGSPEHENNYLKDFQRVQAEFDNYRKRMQTALLDARHDGFMQAVEGFLPAIDSFKMATDMITDKNTLMGIKFIEKGILDTLSKMGVEAIDATGKFNPDLHQAIEAEDKEGYESGDIIKEAYKGFTYKSKVIRYSQVIVQK